MRALQESDEGFAGKNMSACPPDDMEEGAV